MLVDILLQIKKPEKPLEYLGYLEKIHGWVNKVLGNNHYGKMMNDYVYTPLMTDNSYDYHYGSSGIEFKNDPFMLIRVDDEKVNLSESLINIGKNPIIFDDLSITGVNVLKVNTTKKTYKTPFCSPTRMGQHWKYVDSFGTEWMGKVENYLKECVLQKAKEGNFEINEDFSIKVIREERHCDYMYRNQLIKGYNFVVKINAPQNVKEFILSQGLGRSNGIGLGFLM